MPKLLLAGLLLFFSLQSEAAERIKVIMLKGDAFAKLLNNKTYKLKMGHQFDAAAVLTTKDKSILKVQLPDGTLITVGPNSEMELNAKNTRKPTIVNLINGQIRGVVNENLKKENSDHKVLIKTRSAALGVRGTDFYIVHNDQNNITSNITLKGKVDFYKNDDAEILERHQEELDGGKQNTVIKAQDGIEIEDKLKNYKTIKVPPGSFSGAFPSYEAPLEPVRISNAQLVALYETDAKKKGTVYKGDYHVSLTDQKNDILVPTPRGTNVVAQSEYNNQSANSSGIRPGGIVDLNSGIYISPPSNSRYDKRTGLYVMPDDLGGVEASTGEYIPPTGVRLDPVHGFVANEKAYSDRNFKENFAKLKSLTGSFNEKLTQTLSILKQITRLDLYGVGNYRYQTNAMENYYGEWRKITGQPSMIWDLQGHGGFQLFHNQRYLWYPKASIQAYFHERTLPQVKELNQYTGMLGIEFHRKHYLFGRRARLIADVEFTTQYTDYRRRNLFDFYTEDASLKLIERFNFNHINTIELFYQIRSYAGYQDPNHGNIHNAGILHRLYLGANFDMEWTAFHSERREKWEGQAYKIEEVSAHGIIKDILSRTDLSGGYTYQWHKTRKSTERSPFDSARYYKADITLNRRLNNFWKLNFLYEYSRQRAKGETTSETRSFINQTYGGGLTMVF
ncbi:MAG: hypothetical protein COW00_14510 [Bdellovibrio sp. CG12_big_fil_rev_8_21_14_0_65_39_13]|nr:MAG: hypothetical protein COW78_07750 [Bdellovibrio sp. CG22_combo_CG10-13_8_21_14_all_39_27]PIQ58824.1 MAG: hypothetical protein COW00_14510 [Bdellovibrio sp. CG12_big_fil_rev_8_21_14_0_65_39_13]PIR35498.1 MAG: hypothetical protein COV37_08440 [Bdellovibrio sp. CG11_big_fil_rev_8_21_14_0_20_39_38]PJB54194.1 MAG: hypothetical protein CO099_02995 [Bdellovibrio sp. CG_4_9_14_3_um_filter_39_7]